jgi:hypothetical protein
MASSHLFLTVAERTSGMLRRRDGFVAAALNQAICYLLLVICYSTPPT